MERMLPETPRAGMLDACKRECAEELFGAYLVYSRVSWMPEEDGFQGWDWGDDAPRAKWAAHCTCTACGETFYAGWKKGGGLRMDVGPDESFFSGVPDEDGEFTIEFDEGAWVSCPYCSEQLRTVRKSSLRGGRTMQIMACSVETVERKTALLFWLVSCRIGAEGVRTYKTAPMFACVLDGDGRTVMYSHAAALPGRGWAVPSDRWRRCGYGDPMQKRYQSWGAWDGNQVGGWVWGDVPDQAGLTGEKTGLADYIAQGGANPVLYLRFRKKHPNVENLVKAGWGKQLDQVISREARNAVKYGRRLNIPHDAEGLADWKKNRPHEMLGMTKQAVQRGDLWEGEWLLPWRRLSRCGGLGPGDELYFLDCLERYGVGDLIRFSKWAEEQGALQLRFRKIERYLRKQKARGLVPAVAFQIFQDYRDMLAEATRDPEEVELWPPDLRRAHDRLAATRKLRQDAAKDRKFREVAEKWNALEWSNGEICAVLPRCVDDLVREGETLKHCVGGYGDRHISGKLIIFIRHARRPERSWFTLNEDLTGKAPERIQLHGYGNELAHGKKLRIPREVEDFCDRWEREVLAPTFLSHSSTGRGQA